MLWSKLVKFLMSILKRQVDSSPNFAQSSVSTPLYFFSSNNIYFAQVKQLRWTFLRLSGAWVKIRQFLMSILKRQVNCSSNFASFFNVMTHNSFVNFKLIPFLLWIKRPQQTPNFETFKYSGENLQYS